MEEIKLTNYARGAGCGCKIAPAVLQEIIHGGTHMVADPRLLVGHAESDDAAVLDMGNGKALISTTDFFTPIVDDAFDLGRIAATNALSDIYAMGGTPLVAIAILGWPVEKLPAAMAARMIDGARQVCAQEGIALGGGHSIDSPEPFFGLAVTGEAPIANIKRNSTAKAGDLIYLTKPIGIGILSTARKRGVLPPEHAQLDIGIMCESNKVGRDLGALAGVHAMTDVTGFGLFGHLLEMCEGSELAATIEHVEVPKIPPALELLQKGIYPDGTFRNWKSYGQKVKGADAMDVMMLYSDPQTSGGLLIGVDPNAEEELRDILQAHAVPTHRIGKFHERKATSAIIEVI